MPWLSTNPRRPCRRIARKDRWHRISTFDLLCGIEWQLYVCLRKGLVFADVTAAPLLLPINLRSRFTFRWDMGPDNLCATLCLLNCKRLRMSVFFSIVHKCQRALWGGMQLSGKYSVVLVGCQLANCGRGPWDGASADIFRIRERPEVKVRC